MDSFFGRIRSGAGKVAFEAEKLRRQTALQGTISNLRKEEGGLLQQLGEAAYAAYDADQIQNEDLVLLCQKIADIQVQIREQELAVEQIKKEVFAGEAPVPQFGRLCPNGHGLVPEEHNFCQECGARPIFVEPPVPTRVSNRLCSNCQAPLPEEAQFCSECGQKVPPPPRCPSCQAPLQPEASFCAECGHRLEASAGTEAVIEPETKDAEPEQETATSPEHCPTCGQERAGTQFCTQCGYQFPAD